MNLSNQNKTSLGLHDWKADDKPVRLDFAEDNQLLDSLLTAHFNDNSRHKNADDPVPMTINSYVGDGKAQQVVSLPFAARLVLVFRQNLSVVGVRPGGEWGAYCAFAVPSDEAMAGLLLDGDSLTVMQDSSKSTTKVHNSFNESNIEYEYIAFR
ncbi:conserved protein of unknown function [Ruminococcaceae bacterium BL-4]|nr:conserved protein of unknown function [Ruminococcaceae bacterium BL-4]